MDSKKKSLLTEIDKMSSEYLQDIISKSDAMINHVKT